MYIFSAKSSPNGTRQRVFLSQRNVANQKDKYAPVILALIAFEGDLPACLICTRVGSHLAPAPMEANT